MRQAEDSPQESTQVKTLLCAAAATQVAAASIKHLNKSSHMLYPVPASNRHRHRPNYRNSNADHMQRLGSGCNDGILVGSFSSESLSSTCRLDNLIPISLCASSMIAIGSLMLAGGVVVMIFDHMELGPPQFDDQYERYSGSSLSEIVGPLLVASGSLCLIGNVSLLMYLSYEYYLYKRSKKPNSDNL